MKIAFITSVFGGMDSPKIIPDQSVDFTHYHFSEACKARSLDHLDDRMKSLYFKAQHHRVVDADFYIYVDGKVQVLSNDFIEQALKQLGESDVAFLKHQERSCVYEEVDFIESEIQRGNKYLTVRYAHRPLREEVEFYRELGYPENNGLNDCCIFIRRNSEKANDLFNQWWNQILTGSFDQTAIQYVAWLTETNIIPLQFRQGSFKLVNHKKLQ